MDSNYQRKEEKNVRLTPYNNFYPACKNRVILAINSRKKHNTTRAIRFFIIPWRRKRVTHKLLIIFLINIYVWIFNFFVPMHYVNFARWIKKNEKEKTLDEISRKQMYKMIRWWRDIYRGCCVRMYESENEQFSNSFRLKTTSFRYT